MNYKLNFLKTSVILLAILGMSMQGCVKNKCDQTYEYMSYTPAYMSLDELRTAAKVETPQDLVNPGQIFVRGNYLFVNEIGKGTHVIDNSNPSSPVFVAFLTAPGNYGIASKCNNLYLDSGVDLLVFDITEPSRARLKNRVEDAFPQVEYFNGYSADISKGIVVNWIAEAKSETYDCNQPLPANVTNNRVVMTQTELSSFNGQTSASRSTNPTTSFSQSGGTGTAGSYARFVVAQDHLYVLTTGNNTLKIYDASNCDQPTYVHDVTLDIWGGAAETLFPYGDKLFVGATNGMSILDNSNPTNPVVVGQFDHVSGCDPVVVEGNRAYVTLRSGNGNGNGPCQGWTNQLDVVDISDISNPQGLATHTMSGPQGVGIDNNVLFICDGDVGLKVFDATDANTIPDNLITTITSEAFDVIPNNGTLIAIGKDGLTQYDYTNTQNIFKLSFIPVVK